MRKRFKKRGLPIISADTKKKELIGNFANSGARWSREPDDVNAHDFPGDAIAKAAPYAVYDVTANAGYVGVGLGGDTPRFAATVIAGWWRSVGRRRYPTAKEILVLVDAGGSNGYRTRGFKFHLQRLLAERYGLTVHVCHYPRGASKWNPVEHRLLSAISANWAGIPLRDVDTVLRCIRGTRTRTGLTVVAVLVQGAFPTGELVPDSDWQTLAAHLHPGKVCPAWNYTLTPTPQFPK